MAQDNDFFGGFEAFAGTLANQRTVSSISQEDDNIDVNEDHIEDVDPEDLENKLENEEELGTTIEENEEDTQDLQEEGDDETNLTNKDNEEDTVDLSEAEPEIAQFLQDKLAETLGWEFEEDDKFKNVEDVVEFLKEVVEVNSKPEYANDEIEKLNEFVSNGGDVRDYISASRGELDLEKADISKPDTQKTIIKELLKEKGYTDARIQRSIERYEDAGTLEEEAEDAKELLTEVREEKTKKLLEQKQKEKEAVKEQQQKYVSSVEQSVKTLESVRGIPISDKEKKQLLEYIFKPTADGRTQYQKDYLTDSKNLIESAYFTMKGDAFVQKVQRKANSNAAINLKKKLTTNKSTKQKDNTSGFSWNKISSQLRRPI